jgi:hypothetical protein
MTSFVWIGIAFCIVQSAILNGLNLAVFAISKLELEIEVAKNNRHARRVLALRENANLLLVTILWGIVAAHVLLTLLSGSVFAGVAAFFFSTFVITIFGEIIPQAYFLRRALKVAAILSPLLRVYQVILFPIARPTAFFLDKWLGPEAISYYKERDIRELLKLHMSAPIAEIEKAEGQGALNFLALDDVRLADEGEPVDPRSVLRLGFDGDTPVFPPVEPDASDELLRRIHLSGKSWIVLADENDEPRMVLDSDEFIRDALFNPGRFNPHRHCHRPIIARSADATIGDIITRLKVKPRHSEDDVVDHDVILLWGPKRRVITGSDVLGRLLRGIVENPAAAS